MKNSLGTLAAVAALAVAATTTTASADIQYATHLFGQIISPGVKIDINNNGTTDYNVINGSRFSGVYHSAIGLENQVVIGEGSHNLYNFAFGDVIDSSFEYSSYGYIDLVTPSIVGFGFYIDENLHYAWLQLGIDGGDLIILDGAWETSANTPLEIIAVPEPTTMAAGIALLVGAAALLRRRV